MVSFILIKDDFSLNNEDMECVLENGKFRIPVAGNSVSGIYNELEL